MCILIKGVGVQFSKILKEKRAQRGLTQEQLSIKVGIAQDKISRLENNVGKVSFEEAYQISKYLGFSLEDCIEQVAGADLKSGKGLNWYLNEILTLIKKDCIKDAESILKKKLSESESMEQRECLALLSNCAFWKGDFAQAIQYADSCINQFKKTDFNNTSYLLALMFKLLSISLSNDKQSGKTLFELLRQNSAQLSSVNYIFYLQIASWYYFHQNSPKEALEVSTELTQLAIEHGLDIYKGVGLLFRGWAKASLQCPFDGYHDVETGWMVLRREKASITYSLYLLIKTLVFIQGKEILRANHVLDDLRTYFDESYTHCYFNATQLVNQMIKQPHFKNQ